MLRRFFSGKSSKLPLLGRWDQKISPEIKSIWANYDHCGDSICKDPMEVQKHIDDELLKIKKKQEEEERKKINNVN